MKPKPLMLTDKDLAKLAKTGTCVFREKLFWQPRLNSDGNMTIYDNRGSWMSRQVVRRNTKTGRETVPPGGIVRAVIICPECYERRAKNEATVMTRILDTSPITPETCRSLGFTQLEAEPNVWFLDQGGEILSVVFTDDGRAVIPALDSFTERNAGQLYALVIATSKGAVHAG